VVVVEDELLGLAAFCSAASSLASCFSVSVGGAFAASAAAASAAAFSAASFAAFSAAFFWLRSGASAARRRRPERSTRWHAFTGDCRIAGSPSSRREAHLLVADIADGSA
jgi:hypothetical protein